MKNEDFSWLPELKDINITSYIWDFKKDNASSEDAVELAFSTYQNDNDLAGVLIKVIVLNERYSTRLTDNKLDDDKLKDNNNSVDVITMAEHIRSIQSDIAEYVDKEEKKRLINAYKKVGQKYKQQYSFATKYCCWNYKSMGFYIVDNYVIWLLYSYGRKLGIEKTDELRKRERKYYTYKDLEDYERFCELYDIFFEKLGEVNTYKFKDNREKDMFLWQLAKSLKEPKNDDSN